MSKSGTRAAHGSGTIRKKTVTRKGQSYTYWEARVTVGRDPGTGRQIQRSFTGQTQREVREKMQAAAVAVNEGTYRDPVKLTVGEWLDIWVEEYLGSLKPASVTVYKNNVKNHIKPAMAAVKLAKLQPHTVQRFINGLDGLSASSVRLAYKVYSTRPWKRPYSWDICPRTPLPALSSHGWIRKRSSRWKITRRRPCWRRPKAA